MEPAPDRRPALSRRLLPAGVATLGVGVAVAISGVVVAPLFVPGTWIIATGLALLAGAGLPGGVRAGS